MPALPGCKRNPPVNSDPPILASGPTLELRDVTKFYGQFKAVDSLSFSLRPGSICGFLGPNGAGKTTTIRIILEIIKPSSGALTVLGHRSALQVRHRLGYLPEEKGLYKKMKTWAVIAYFASLKGLDRKTTVLRPRSRQPAGDGRNNSRYGQAQSHGPFFHSRDAARRTTL